MVKNVPPCWLLFSQDGQGKRQGFYWSTKLSLSVLISITMNWLVVWDLSPGESQLCIWQTTIWDISICGVKPIDIHKQSQIVHDQIYGYDLSTTYNDRVQLRKLKKENMNSQWLKTIEVPQHRMTNMNVQQYNRQCSALSKQPAGGFFKCLYYDAFLSPHNPAGCPWRCRQVW